MELLGIFNKDGCNGLLKLRNQQSLDKYAKLAGKLRGVFVDVGFEAVKNNTSLNLFDYVHYIDAVSRVLRTKVYYVVPDSHDLTFHLNNMTIWDDLARMGKVKVSGEPVAVIHYYWDAMSGKIMRDEHGNKLNVRLWYRLMLMRYKDHFGNVVVGIPARVLTLSWNSGNPVKLQCKFHPDRCVRYIEKAIIELSNDFTHFHLLGINRREWRWLTRQLRGGSLGRLNVIISADTDNYRLASSNKLRRVDYGKGLFMVPNDDIACEWFKVWVMGGAHGV